MRIDEREYDRFELRMKKIGWILAGLAFGWALVTFVMANWIVLFNGGIPSEWIK